MTWHPHHPDILVAVDDSGRILAIDDRNEKIAHISNALSVSANVVCFSNYSEHLLAVGTQEEKNVFFDARQLCVVCSFV